MLAWTWFILKHWVLLWIVGTLIYLALATLMSQFYLYHKHPTPRTVNIYMRREGLHTDMILPIEPDRQMWFDLLGWDDLRNDEFKWIEVAMISRVWTCKRNSLYSLLFWFAGSSFMEVKLYKELPQETDKRKLYVRKVSRQQVDILLQKYRECFVLQQDKAIETHEPPLEHEFQKFYLSTCYYHMFMNCNTWTNEMMQGMQIPAPIFTIWPGSVVKAFTTPPLFDDDFV